MQCRHQFECSGCSWLELSALAQKDKKISLLRSGLEDLEKQKGIDYFLIGPFHFRERADLIFSINNSQGALGFYQKDFKTVFSLDNCPLLTPQLQDYFDQIKNIQFPIKKGSLRIRSGIENNFGIWLDFANLDIKHLLEERSILEKLLSLGEVEIGQRRKSLSKTLKLSEPKFSPWSKTWINQGRKEFPLLSCLGSFSQTGTAANQIITRELGYLLDQTEGNSWVEFGSGTGTLSFCLASHRPNIQLTAVEFDELAAEAFLRSLETLPELQTKIHLSTGDFQKKRRLDFRPFSSVLVNPPRSGLGDFLQPLEGVSVAQRPKEFIYMSCHLHSFLKDIQVLRTLNYQLTDLKIIDQFPHTEHFEILSLWKL